MRPLKFPKYGEIDPPRALCSRDLAQGGPAKIEMLQKARNLYQGAYISVTLEFRLQDTPAHPLSQDTPLSQSERASYGSEMILSLNFSSADTETKFSKNS